MSVVADVATESLLSKKLSADDEEGKRLSEMEWGIDGLIIVVGDETLLDDDNDIWSCPFVWSIVVLLTLFSC